MGQVKQPSLFNKRQEPPDGAPVRNGADQAAEGHFVVLAVGPAPPILPLER